ncbi:MAG TPA: hypothetical protein VF884_02290 [Nitrososphaeraceae archaeon]
MSLTTVTVKNRISELGEMLRMEWREHNHEIIIGAIMAGVGIAITVAVTGNVNDAFAGSRRR